MKQQNQWVESEEAKKANESVPRVQETPNSRVAVLRRWQNIFTGETCEQTTREFCESKGISLKRANDLVVSGTKKSKIGWVHLGAVKRVIQGNPIDWLLNRATRGGSKAFQPKETISLGWNYVVPIVALYNRGLGLKRISKRFEISQLTIWKILREAGINTSARSTYQRGELKLITTSRNRYLRVKSNPSLLIQKRVMNRIWSAMKRQSVNHSGSFAVVGCTADELRDHIESQFQVGMTFENYGKWHIDHIKPCASFDLRDPKQMAECFNWRNLQPLWAKDNISKGSRYGQS